MHLRAYSEISFQDFFENYSLWLEENAINDLLTSQSSRKINEVFTFFIIQQQNEEFFENFSAVLENMIDDIYSDYSKRISLLFKVGPEWNSVSEKIFALMDDEKKGHIAAEGLQLWTLCRTLSKVTNLEPILLRKQTFSVLQEMKHTNGLVSMRSFKNYLINGGWVSLQSVQELLDELIKVKECWQEVRSTVFSSEQFAKYHICSENPAITTLWEQCIAGSIQEFVNTGKDGEKLYKFLKFTGLMLGSTPNLATKGIIYIQGTYLRDISEFSVYLMNNYLQIAGQYHTSASISALTQQAIDTLSSDSRFKAIRKALQTYDSLLNIILYEVIAKTEEKVEKVQVEKSETGIVWQYSSTTSILNGLARSVSYRNAEKSPNKSPIRRNNLKKWEKNGKSRENFESRGNSSNLGKIIDYKKEIRPLTPVRDKDSRVQPGLSPKVERRPNDRKREEVSKSPLRVSGNRARTPTKNFVGDGIEVKAVFNKEKGFGTNRTPTREKPQKETFEQGFGTNRTPTREKPQKETYEQVIKRLVNKKL